MRRQRNEEAASVPILAVSIHDIKVKTVNSKPVVQYLIIVKVDGTGHLVKHTYFDLNSLHKGLTQHFQAYNSINLPHFPVISNHMSPEITTRALDLYLNSLCRSEFLCEILLDFLEI